MYLFYNLNIEWKIDLTKVKFPQNLHGDIKPFSFMLGSGDSNHSVTCFKGVSRPHLK